MTYLNGLIADKEITVDPGDAEEVNDVYVDYSNTRILYLLAW